MNRRLRTAVLISGNGSNLQAVIDARDSGRLDVDITHGPKYGHTVVWREPDAVPSFFLSYSGPGPIDLKQWEPLMKPPAHLRPARVQVDFDVARFEDLFVELMSVP